LGLIYIGLGTGFDRLFNPKYTGSYSAINFAIRASGVGIADIVDFDFIYRIKGGDPTTTGDQVGFTKQPDEEGGWENDIGLYVNLGFIKNLGIGVGYSMNFLVSENGGGNTATSTLWQNVNPLYNGIDLNFGFDGVEKLNVGLSNNISFAVVDGRTDNAVRYYGMAVHRDRLTGLLDDDQETWMGLKNVLSIGYTINDNLSAGVEIGNKLGWSTYTLRENKDNTYNVTNNTLNLGVNAGYSFGNASFGLGLSAEINNQKYEEKDVLREGGSFTFRVPVSFGISF